MLTVNARAVRKGVSLDEVLKDGQMVAPSSKEKQKLAGHWQDIKELFHEGSDERQIWNGVVKSTVERETSGHAGITPHNATVLKWAMMLYTFSQGAYDHVRKVFNLPSGRTIVSILQWMKPKPGVVEEMLFHMRRKADEAGLTAAERDSGLLIWDGMVVQGKFVLNPHTNQIEGAPDMGSLLMSAFEPLQEQGEAEIPITHALLQFFWVSTSKSPSVEVGNLAWVGDRKCRIASVRREQLKSRPGGRARFGDRFCVLQDYHTGEYLDKELSEKHFRKNDRFAFPCAHAFLATETTATLRRMQRLLTLKLHAYGFGTRMEVKDGAEINRSLQKELCDVPDEYGVLCGHRHPADRTVIIRDSSDVVHGVKKGEGSLRKSGHAHQHTRYMLKSVTPKARASGDAVKGLRWERQCSDGDKWSWERKRTDFAGFEEGCDTRVAAVRSNGRGGWAVEFETMQKDQPIVFSTIEGLVARDKNRAAPDRLARKLNVRTHLQPKGSDVMKVNRAAQILSGSVQRALQQERHDEYRKRLRQCYDARKKHPTMAVPYQRAEVLDARQTQQTEAYVGKFNDLLDLMNSRKPVLSPSDPRLDEIISISDWFQDWWTEIDALPGDLSATEKNAWFITQKLFHDLKCTCHAFVAHCREYLRAWPDSMVFPVR